MLRGMARFAAPSGGHIPTRSAPSARRRSFGQLELPETKWDLSPMNVLLALISAYAAYTVVNEVIDRAETD